MLSSQVEKYACAQCWGPVVLKHFDEPDETGDHWRAVCPKGCEPGGLVSAAWVERQRTNDQMNSERVRHEYPELDPLPERTPEEKSAARKALFD